MSTMKKKIKCMICKEKDATVHFAEITNGQIKKMHLCDECATQKGIGVNISFSVADLIAGLSPESHFSDDAQKCPACGMEIQEFKNSGRLGCSQCYEAFSKVLNHIIESVHKNTVHTGKMPPNVEIREDEQNRLERIHAFQTQLQQALEKEDYEKAAELRDKIKTLKQKRTA